MKVSAIVVTRGDVEIQPVIDSLPKSWEIVVWDNGERMVTRSDGYAEVCTDVAVYGRYAAIEHATGDLIYVQDDDVVVSDPQEIVEWWHRWNRAPEDEKGHAHGVHVVCNMPQEFRHAFYQEHALVGFGAVFLRDAPERAFSRFMLSSHANGVESQSPWFDRTCDIVFTGLAHRVLVDVPVTNLPHAYAEHRMYRSVGHVLERRRMLERVMAVARG